MTKEVNKLRNIMLVYIALSCVFSIAESNGEVSVGKLTILNHTSSSVVNKTITLTPMAYNQHLPNLQTLQIRVIKAIPFDACTPLDTAKIFPLQDNSKYTDTFVLVDGQSGGCKYWRKAEMAREAMVKGIIIIDDNHTKHSNQAYDYNNGHFFSFLIDPKDSKDIMPGDKEQFQAKLSITQTAAPKQKKQLYLWLSSLNQESYEYLHWWNQTLINLPGLQDKIEWQPKYVFYGKNEDQKKHVYSCACNGLFCSPQFHEKRPDVLIKQDLRQKLIYQNYKKNFMHYIELFTQRCLDNYLKEMYIQECARTQMINAQINETQINKRVQSFLGQCSNDSELFGQLLTDKGRFSMIGSYPVILLNRQILQFTNQNQLQALLCRKFSLQESQGCIQNYRTTIKEIVVSIVFFLLILLGLFGVGFFVVMCYKNRLRKEMHKQVKMQVSTAVQHYFQLSQETSAKN